MATLRLVIANKNYSSWSMRPWLVLEHFGIAFDEVMLAFDTPQWEQRDDTVTPTRTVPVLWVDEQPVWDSLAIAETLAEMFPDRGLWPIDAAARRHARAMAAQMHSGFSALRTAMPMNIRAQLPGRGHTPAALHDIEQIEHRWTESRARFGGDGEFLLGPFGIVDAMFAPVIMRFATYGVQLPPVAAAYAAAVRALPAVRSWCNAALTETAFVPHDEPYQTAPGVPVP